MEEKPRAITINKGKGWYFDSIMVVPIIYRKSPDKTIASYNFTEIAGGVSFVQLFGSKIGAAGTDYKLSSIELASNGYDNGTDTHLVAPYTRTRNSWTETTYTVRDDPDFDVIIGRNITFEGTALVQVPLGAAAAGAGAVSAYVIAKLRKWVDPTETEIAASAASVVISEETGVLSVYITVPKTKFIKGEVLRLTIEIYAKYVGGGGGEYGYGYLYHDPLNTTVAGYATTQLAVLLPTEVNI